MADVTLYSTRFCPYCFAAKRLLTQKGVEFEEIDVSFDPQLRRTMTEKAGGVRSVPQIFIGETHVGGCDELYGLEQSGDLDPLLSA
jgi:glutaredoxin 3